MTNKEKFERIFGFMPDTDSIQCDIAGSEEVCKKFGGCTQCPFDDWWNQKYKPIPAKTFKTVKELTEEEIADEKGWFN